MADNDPRVTLREAGARYGVSTRTLRRWISSGILPAWRVGPRMIRVQPADVERLAHKIPTN
jgi:excisionase family DNA binding protein